MRNYLLILALLVAVTHSASLLTYTFPYKFTSQFNEYSLKPTYSLGSLTVNNTLQVVINVPGQANLNAADIQTLFTIYYLDNTVVPSTYLPYAPVSVFIQGSTYTITADITEANLVFSNGATGKDIPTTTFLIGVDNTAPTVAFDPLTYFYIQVNYYPTQTGVSVANANSKAVLLKVVDVFRTNIIRVVYVSKDNLKFSFTQFPDDGATVQFSIAKLNIDITKGYISNGVAHVAIADVPTITNANGITTYTYNALTTGYYVITNDFSGILKDVTGRITLETDPYACPYSADYNDYYLNFQGCTRTPTNAFGVPCASFDAVTQTCSLCIMGYELINGTCYANTTCPARKYFSYGSCLDVSATCGDFDKFTGNCNNCADPANYYLDSGKCLRRSVTCGARQWQTNYTCFNVSSTCDTFDVNTGFCLTCISNLYQLNTDGTCTLIVVVCPQGQYAKGLVCVSIANECLKFNVGLEKCQGCVKGYYVQNGACKRIICPVGQVPSNYGIFCENVSPLCGDYDPISGNCLTCKNTGYAVRNGKCLQEVSPLAGCQEREDLGFGPCVGADLNCKTFNLETGNCDECIPNFYLDYTGHCVENAKCGVGQWSVNGECLGVPDNCLKVDDLGLCTLCINKNYRLHQGQCVYFKSCSQHQYLNAGGQCVNVSPNCATWNPSNGQCITCKLANTNPTGGVCCPSGQIYSSGKCVVANDLQNSYQSATGPSCLIRHPSLTICLKCAQGYDPVYTLPFTCKKIRN